MAKKRVHEIAKELKSQGIEMDNKELVSELQALDFDVKSHSSSMDEDQAVVAIEKILQKRKPKPAPAPVQAVGFVVRRRKVEAAPPQVLPASAEAPAAQVEAPEVAEPEVAPVEEVVAQRALVTEELVPLKPGAAEVQAEAPAAAQPVAAVAASEPVGQAGAAQPVQVLPAPAAAAAAEASMPKPASVRPQPPSVDPRTLRPTATQAVVISRPLIPVRRVTPPSDAHKRIPAAPGQRAIGEVREFKVGTDFLGRREFLDVTKDHAKKKTGARQDARTSVSKQELVDLARGRPALPIRAGKKRKPTKKGAKTQITQMAEEKKVIKIEAAITVADLSKTLGVKATELIRKLMSSGTMATINTPLDVETAAVLASDYGWRVEKKGFELENYISEAESPPEELETRPPVVTIMGHVDHGKTSLLDAIRHARVAQGEAGGITQHIGAYSVDTEGGKPVTFLDTPGHEAFTAMRARGAKVTDLVVIVVAADDGVMPQTREAVNHAKAAEVPILVAINKIDKPAANPQHVKNQLMEFGLVDESLGGDTIMVPVSAKTKVGLDNLLEMILLQSEVLDLKSNPSRPARGTVVEAKIEKGRGPVATVIVSEGTLKAGDALVTGTQHGKVRAMLNDRGEKVDTVLPGFPAEVLGLSGVPTAGDDFYVVETEAAAKEIATHRQLKEREKDLSKTAKVRLEDLFAKAQHGEVKELKLVVKADVQGSVEAVSESLQKLSGAKVTVSIIHAGVGGPNETDVMLASASNGIIIGFNVRPEPKAAEVAAQQGVDIRSYTIIYEAVDEVRKAMEGLLEPTRRERTMGRAEVRNLFSVPKLGTIAGCAVVDGKIARSALVRLIRDSKQIYQGKIGSLRRFKDDVREVASGFECGMSIENYTDIKQGDIIEAYEIEEIRPSLD